jgi:DNA-binding Lrp family transcriptional regulator
VSESTNKYTGFAAIYQLEQEKLKRAGAASPATPANGASTENNATPAKTEQVPRQNAAPALPAAPANNAVQMVRPQPDLLASVPDRQGYLRLPYQIIDHLLPQLEPLEAHIYLHLYRLSWGFGNSSCTITNAGLARRCNISERTVRNTTPRLRDKGLIEKIRVVEGSEGIEWRVAIPAGAAKSAVAANSSGVAEYADSNRKALKENNKKENELTLDTKECPDCQGSGFYYPEGVEKGVAKCKHTRLTEGK